MPRLIYTPRRFSPESQDVIVQANDILHEYAAQGFDLTLRQLYYQFVSRDLMPNVQASYNRLGSIVNDARLAGQIDWEHIVDRTRNLRAEPHWHNPAHAVESMSRWFHIDKWAGQPYRLEVWIEKDALVGVIEGVCQALDVPYFSCRGYTSQSEMWAASQRLGRYLDDGRAVRILHLGDHDPSGIDMTRDIEDRLRLFLENDQARDRVFAEADERDVDVADLPNRKVLIQMAIDDVEERFAVERLALNMDQVEQYDPPPNPAKVTDSRAAGYIREYGRESWELDALEPTVLAGLITDAVETYRDPGPWDEAVATERRYLDLLGQVSDRWTDVEALLDGREER